jgi:hypothetical protein
MPFRLSTDPPSFGYLGAGFVYKLKVSLTNIGEALERFKVLIQTDDPEEPNDITCDFKVTNLAPGMSVRFNLELRAESCYETTYTMLITTSSSKITEMRVISALVIPQETFKKVARSLMLRDRGIYASGVSCVGQLSGENAGPSIISGAPTIYSEALIDDEELDV